MEEMILQKYKNVYPKVILIWELALTLIFKMFPANIWILKFLFYHGFFATKMSLDNIYGRLLNILEF